MKKKNKWKKVFQSWQLYVLLLPAVIWILVFACYLSIVSKFAMNIFKKILNISTKKPLIDIFALLILALALLPKNLAISQNFESNIYPYLVISIVFCLGLGILIFANLAKRREQKING